MVAEISQDHSSAEVVKDFTFDVLDYGKEFAKGFIDGGIERPLNGIGQFVSLGHLPAVDLVELDKNVSGGRKIAQTLGSTAGVIFDYVLLAAVTNKFVSKLLGIPATALSTRLGSSALTGFVSGSVLEPLKLGESQWNRLSNGATQAVAFTAMDGISTGLAAKFGTPTLLNSITRGGVAGFGAGVVHANMDSLTHGRGLASGPQMLSEGGSWGTGGAIMGGLSYGLAKWTAGDRSGFVNKSEGGTAYTAEGEQARISVQRLENGGSQIASVELPDGTRLTRQGTADRWVANAGTEQSQAWNGDIRLSPENKLQYVYKYAKAPSVVTVDVRLPDGSRVALQGGDGSLTLPSATIDSSNQTLADGALASLRKLNVDIPEQRLKIEGVSTSGSVNTNYSVELTVAEALKLRQSISSSSSVQIVAGDKAIPIATPAGAPSAAPALTENVAGEYVYDRPMPDHTSTVAFMFKGDDQRIKVLTGARKAAPFEGKDALPGGFLDISGKTVETPAQAAARELMEETGLKMGEPTLVRIGDSLNRDPRNRVIDFQFGVFGNKSDLSGLHAGDDLGNLQVRDVEQLLKDPNALAFDHHQTLSQAYRNLSRIIGGGGQSK